MRRREAQRARDEQRQERTLVASDYLLGVHDSHRMGALRFSENIDGPFLDNSIDMASPPWTSLRELEQVSLALEGDDAAEHANYATWLRMLIAPGGSLGGARPKASVLDPQSALWIAKFPSTRDDEDIGAWEGVVHELAQRAGLVVPEAKTQTFGSEHHTFLSKRFDRGPNSGRVHFASAMTLLQRNDGDDAALGASYLELATLIVTKGAHPARDLQELWRRIVFSICVSNTDDHLRNHGFLHGQDGWELAPAYDLNPNAHGSGLRLNISETDNSQDVDLALDVAPYFRVSPKAASTIVSQVMEAASSWRAVATSMGIRRGEQERMARAFRLSAS